MKKTTKMFIVRSCSTAARMQRYSQFLTKMLTRLTEVGSQGIYESADSVGVKQQMNYLNSMRRDVEKTKSDFFAMWKKPKVIFLRCGKKPKGKKKMIF